MEFVETPFNYTGSKFKLLPQLIPLFDKTKPVFVDLFAGGGSVYTNVINDYREVYVNDIISDLIGMHRFLIYDVNLAIKMVKNLCVEKTDKEGYHKLRDSYNEFPEHVKLFALMLCCTNNMMRFNKKFKFNQTFGRRTYNANTEKKILEFSNHLNPHINKIFFSSVDFRDFGVVKNAFYYLDPPYSNTEAGYNAYWESNDDLGLFDFCKNIDSIGSTFAVSGMESHDGQRCRLIDLLVNSGFKKINIEQNYNKVSRKGSKESQEVLVVNY